MVSRTLTSDNTANYQTTKRGLEVSYFVVKRRHYKLSSKLDVIAIASFNKRSTVLPSLTLVWRATNTMTWHALYMMQYVGVAPSTQSCRRGRRALHRNLGQTIIFIRIKKIVSVRVFVDFSAMQRTLAQYSAAIKELSLKWFVILTRTLNSETYIRAYH